MAAAATAEEAGGGACGDEGYGGGGRQQRGACVEALADGGYQAGGAVCSVRRGAWEAREDTGKT